MYENRVTAFSKQPYKKLQKCFENGGFDGTE